MTLPNLLYVLLGAVIAFIPTVLVMSRNSNKVTTRLRILYLLETDKTQALLREIAHLPQRKSNGTFAKRESK